MRIVSLLPSATEIVCALGLADSLVGISHDCDYPPEIRNRPVLSEAVVTGDLPSAVIDARIREQVHRGRSVYHLDEAQLARLRPDLILTQELCRVCAPSYSLVQQAAKILDAKPGIVSLEPRGLRDILANIQLVGDLTGTSTQARAIVDGLQERIDAVSRAVAGTTRPRVACLEWLEPIFVGGHWVPEMVEVAGGHDVLGRAGEPSFVVEWDQVVAAQPDVIVLMPCGFDIPRTRRELDLLTTRPGWEALSAVRAGRVYLTDASAYFNRPGPRIVTGLEILAAILHPDRFPVPLPPHSVEEWRPAASNSRR
ncbi:MAG: cobalamin-binding protein [Armatimonadota bacterium]|nr:cobalamin-binding protein [Armatimonadota bacterium]MDR7467539.1 cobalamin-binding protein [Armatimonadota bacterium]MDR7494500.1 cobalamin-binding protein [Armatimonadota bacterium]MDR7499761.1 cobalamin-binding protein [Armatimonadota bacterium]MDR7504954.1 cobalamin-binding protein [Armatimonadota bacterium]